MLAAVAVFAFVCATAFFVVSLVDGSLCFFRLLLRRCSRLFYVCAPWPCNVAPALYVSILPAHVCSNWVSAASLAHVVVPPSLLLALPPFDCNAPRGAVFWLCRALLSPVCSIVTAPFLWSCSLWSAVELWVFAGCSVRCCLAL